MSVNAFFSTSAESMDIQRQLDEGKEPQPPIKWWMLWIGVLGLIVYGIAHG